MFQTKKENLNFELGSFVLVSDFELSLSLGATQPVPTSAPIPNGHGDWGKWSNIGPVACGNLKRSNRPGRIAED